MRSQRIKEMVAMTLIGDGVLTAVDPERHMKLWRLGPKACTRTVDALTRRPVVSRVLGVAATVMGVWWASRQRPSRTMFLRRIA
jgi:hypothetical protein